MKQTLQTEKTKKNMNMRFHKLKKLQKHKVGFLEAQSKNTKIIIIMLPIVILFHLGACVIVQDMSRDVIFEQQTPPELTIQKLKEYLPFPKDYVKLVHENGILSKDDDLVENNSTLMFVLDLSLGLTATQFSRMSKENRK